MPRRWGQSYLQTTALLRLLRLLPSFIYMPVMDIMAHMHLHRYCREDPSMFSRSLKGSWKRWYIMLLFTSHYFALIHHSFQRHDGWYSIEEKEGLIRFFKIRPFILFLAAIHLSRSLPLRHKGYTNTDCSNCSDCAHSDEVSSLLWKWQTGLAAKGSERQRKAIAYRATNKVTSQTIIAIYNIYLMVSLEVSAARCRAWH